MKVLFILDDYSIGIPETSLIAYFKYLKMNRWTIIFAIKSIKEQPCFRDLDLYIDRLYNLNFDLDDCSSKSILFLFNQINEIVLKENVNLVHIYSPFCIQCVFLSCVENNIPAILTLYDNFSFSSSFPLDYFLNNVILPSIKILTANKRIFETYKNELDIHYLPNPIDEKFWIISPEFKKENYLLLVSGLKRDRNSLIDISIQKLQRFIKEKNLKLAIKVIGVESGKELLIRKYPEVEFLACKNEKEFRELIGNATAIFGIGRIILESLYLGKVTFIINDEGNIIHVNKNNIKDIVELNFYETELHENVSSSLFEKLIQQDGHDISKEYLNQFSAAKIVSQYMEIVNNLVKDFKTYDRNIIVATQLFKNFLQLECNLHTKIAEQEALLSKVKSERDYFYNQLNTIYTSNFWKVARTYYRIRDYTPLRFIYQIIRKLRRKDLIVLLLNRIKKLVGKQVPYEEDFNPYDRITYLKPIAVKDFTNFNKNYHLQKIKFTAICSVYNEEESILDFLKSITLQTVKPEKFIIVDTGSTERTVQLIGEYASLHRDLNIQLIESPVRLNVAQGRNSAIKNASTDIIVSIDAGVEYSPNFFRKYSISIFNINTKYPYPPDLPQKRPLLLYTGALWGEWFDWDLLKKIAESYPEGSVICIGDYGQVSSFSLPNVYFLGLGPQSMLPHYLQHVDCCIIPFKINDITQHTNPLKIYEYLSMGKPVVTTPLADIDALPYTFISHNHEEFLQNIKFALATKVDQNVIKSFVEENSWSRRVEQLLSILGIDE